MRPLSSTLLLVVTVFIDLAFGTSEPTGSSVIKSAINSGTDKLKEIKEKVDSKKDSIIKSVKEIKVKVDETKDSVIKSVMKSSSDKLQQIKDVVDAKKNSLLNRQTIWDKVAETVLTELKKNLPPETCLPGVSAEKIQINQMVKLTKGKLTGFHNVIYNNDAKVVQDGQHSADVEVQLSFKNLRLEYHYEYEGTSLYVKQAKRDGYVTLQIDGETRFTVITTAKKTPVKGNDCYLTIKNAATTGTGQVRTVRVSRGGFLSRPFYFIIKYFSHTVKGVTAIVTAVQEEIKAYVSDALLDVMETAVKKQKGVCGAEQMMPKRDCTVVKNIKNYDP